jgi:Na+-driven multidrug efflux pump
MISFLNFVIILFAISTFVILIAGLIFTARSGEDSGNKINKFMKYRVYFQFITVIILIVAIYARKHLVG